MDSRRTTTRQYSGSIPIFFQHNENGEYNQDTDLPRRESTQIRWDGRHETGRREPDSGLNHTQDYRTRWTDDDWTFTQLTEQPAGRQRRAGGRPAVNRIPEENGCAQRQSVGFTSDGPDSTTSGSDIPEGYADSPLEEEYSEGLISRRPQDGGGDRETVLPEYGFRKGGDPAAERG